jgi:hypothetical protein
MVWIRRWTRFGAMAVMATTAACSTPGERIDGTGVPGEPLVCNRAPGVVGQGHIPANAQLPLTNGPDLITFPRRAMPEGTEVTFAALDSPQVGARLTLNPRPERFKPTPLIIRCLGPIPPGNWKIWRVPDEGEPGGPVPLKTKKVGNGFETIIERNSFFVIAS